MSEGDHGRRILLVGAGGVGTAFVAIATTQVGRRQTRTRGRDGSPQRCPACPE